MDETLRGVYRVTFSDRGIYDIPLMVIARHRAEEYAEEFVDGNRAFRVSAKGRKTSMEVG